MKSLFILIVFSVDSKAYMFKLCKYMRNYMKVWILAASANSK